MRRHSHLCTNRANTIPPPNDSSVNANAISKNVDRSTHCAIIINATTATLDTKNDFISISVDKSGAAFFDKQPVGLNELAQRLNATHQTNENVRVFISGDKDARHGDVIRVLDVVRSSGIQKVAFEIQEAPPKP